MVINHNLMAMNAQRQFNIIDKLQSKHMEKLSSGYRINRAADDAAGLCISETMRKRIAGLRQGMDNIQDGISLCNVADGALNEVHDMLRRMEELAIKAANGTNTLSDRMAIDEEIQHLKTEIDRIGSTTEFNEKLVFHGGVLWVGGASSGSTAEGTFFQLLGNNLSRSGYMNEPLDKDYLDSLQHTYMTQVDDNPFVSVHVDFGELIDKNNNIEALIGTQFYVNCCTNECPTTVVFTDEAGMSVVDKVFSIGVKKADGTYYNSAEEFNSAIVKTALKLTGHVQMACDGSKLYIYDILGKAWEEYEKQYAYFRDSERAATSSGQSFAMTGEAFHIKMSDDSADSMDIVIGILNTTVLNIYDDNCRTMENALKLIEDLKYAYSAVSQMRSQIGAYTNSLEYSYKINANTHENTTAAESRIRDADISEEVVGLSITDILSQAGVLMITQANTSNQIALALLQ